MAALSGERAKLVTGRARRRIYRDYRPMLAGACLGRIDRNGMIFPQVGSWYRRSDRRLFEVVATDADEATVDIQFFDATIGELDLEAWHQLVLEAVPAPEDWSGPLDVDEPELRERWETQQQTWPDHLSFLDQLDRR